MSSRRIEETFSRLRRQRRTGLIPFLTVGFPTVDATLELVPALEGAGAAAIELGVPFSDPLADGATIQAASFHALKHGVMLGTCLEVCRVLRQRGVAMPIVLMGYYNPVLSYGIEGFAQEAARCGVDGLIAVDLPPEESAELRAALATRGLDLVHLLAPTSTEERIALVSATATGFIYCVSLAGVTGARDELPSGVFDLLRRVRAHTQLPLAVGFGISRREHVRAVGEQAQAAVVGSALLNVIDCAPPGEIVQRACRFVAELAGNSRP
ncbi:MAG: tryptophan synthase subunit alpha [Chloroflexi bacterium]|nr:tryptophan synthase subunit alpha [Chloroflexota bacterium]